MHSLDYATAVPHVDGTMPSSKITCVCEVAHDSVCPHTLCCKLRRVEDFDLHKRLYQGKASLLYSATCKKSQLPVAVKVYRKARLSELNWYQVGRHQKTAVPALAHVQLCPPFDAPGYVYVI